MHFAKVIILALFVFAIPVFAGDEARTFQQIAYDITIKDLKPEEWNKFCKKAKDRYEQWSKDNQGSGDLNQFLNDKLLEIAPSVKGGKIEALKKFVYWLALYQQYNQLPPEYIREVKPEYRDQLDTLLQNFQWETLANMIKDNVKKYEDEKAKK